MSKKNNFIIALVVIVSFILVLLFLFWNVFIVWLNYQWIDIVIAAVLAIIAGFVIEYVYRMYSSKSKFSKTTMVMNPQETLATLELPENNILTITERERTIGREDFVGILVADKLLFIGKEHFKLILNEEGFYIEDLNTKNGTEVNGEEIKGAGKVRLIDNDVINIAHTVKIKYHEEDLNSIF